MYLRYHLCLDIGRKDNFAAMHHFADFKKESITSPHLHYRSAINWFGNKCASKFQTRNCDRFLACLLSLCFAPLAWSQAIVIVEESTSESSGSRERAPYVGLGVGLSNLDPDTSEADDIRVLDDDQTGYQLTLGVDLSDWFSVELHGADLGEAEFSGGGTIRYREYGLSGLAYLGGARSRFNCHGWTVFGRTGIGYLSASAGGDLDFRQDNEVSLILGLGAEFSTLSGFGLRAEGIAFDGDVSYLQLGLIYRLGRAPAWMGGKHDVVSKGQQPDRITQERIERMSGQNLRTPSVADKDGDGIDEKSDMCPDTPSRISVGDNGCAVFNGVIDGLTFQSGSAVLTPDARVVLDSIAASLRQQPDARARVSAYTDSQGNADNNLQLSKLRAFEVAKYLVLSGVAKARLEARAFGELRPIDTNTTEQGRSNNRRVEIVLIDE